MSFQSNDTYLKVNGVLVSPGCCWAHYNNGRVATVDGVDYTFSIANDVFESMSPSRLSVQAFISQVSHSDHYLNELLSQLRTDDDLRLEWILVSAQLESTTDGKVQLCGRCTAFERKC